MAFDSRDSWHEHDADEIQQHADACVEEAVKELEKAGWAKESVKVVGEFFEFVLLLALRHHMMILATVIAISSLSSPGWCGFNSDVNEHVIYRNYESARDHCGLES